MAYFQNCYQFESSRPTLSQSGLGVVTHHKLSPTPAEGKSITGKSTHCVFCRKNGELPHYYSSHSVKDQEGRVTCPVLYTYICPRCGATKDKAHTVRYCPSQQRELPNNFVIFKGEGMNASSSARSSRRPILGRSTSSLAHPSPADSQSSEPLSRPSSTMLPTSNFQPKARAAPVVMMMQSGGVSSPPQIPFEPTKLYTRGFTSIGETAKCYQKHWVSTILTEPNQAGWRIRQ